FLQYINELAIKLEKYNQDSKIEILNKIKRIFLESLDDDKEITDDYFYDDIINTIIDVAGHQCSIARLHDVLKIYKKYIDKNIFSNAKNIIETFIQKNRGTAQTRFNDEEWDSLCRTLLNQFNSIYKEDNVNANTKTKDTLRLLTVL